VKAVHIVLYIETRMTPLQAMQRQGQPAVLTLQAEATPASHQSLLAGGVFGHIFSPNLIKRVGAGQNESKTTIYIRNLRKP
jgi:hypothetical protein